VAEHSVLGTRWIYDAARDPVWRSELVRLVRAEQVCDLSPRRGVRPAQARGVRLGPWPDDGKLAIALRRMLSPGPPPSGPGVIGAVMGTWYTLGAGEQPTQGCLAEMTARRS
jgi:hypothetical protein